MTKVGLLRFCEQCSSPVGDLEQHRLSPLCFWFSNVITYKIKMYFPFFPHCFIPGVKLILVSWITQSTIWSGIDQQNHCTISHKTLRCPLVYLVERPAIALWTLAHIITDLFRKSFWHVGVDMFLFICLLCLFCKLTNAWIENQKGLFPLLHSLTSVQGYLHVHCHDGMHSSWLATTEYI